MDRRNFFKNVSITSLGLIFAPAVAKVLAEDITREGDIKCGEGLWAYVQKNGITQYYGPGSLLPDWAQGYQLVYHNYEPVILTGTNGIEIFKKAAYDYQAFWLKLQNALENEK